MNLRVHSERIDNYEFHKYIGEDLDLRESCAEERRLGASASNTILRVLRRKKIKSIEKKEDQELVHETQY